nr:hypothetical protein [Allomuricauda sp.]
MWSKPTDDDSSALEATSSFLLIDGLFTSLEAADILLSLVNDKIKFHTVQQLNSGDPESDAYKSSERRIQQLKSTKSEITQMILEARKEGYELKIHSTIEISKSFASSNISQTNQIHSG